MVVLGKEPEVSYVAGRNVTLEFIIYAEMKTTEVGYTSVVEDMLNGHEAQG